ncbi:alpha-mannosidase, partial [Paenibacillus sepulcri]|nr:alpha-mannosidase [Paenibacillus sepulcri]
EAIIEDSLASLTGSIDTSGFAAVEAEEVYPLVIVNTSGWKRSGVITADIELQRIYFSEGMGFRDMKQALKAIDMPGLRMIDSLGGEISGDITDLGLRFGYELPEDRFRQPYFARSVQVRFELENVPALGHATYALLRDHRPVETQEALGSMITGGTTMENNNLAVTIEADGSLTITDKRTGVRLPGLCVYENTGDIGNEYMYRQPNHDQPITTRGTHADIRVLEDTPYHAAFEIRHLMMIPRSADSLLEQERRELVWFTGRRSGRSPALIPFEITTRVSLDRSACGVKVDSSFNNQAHDHRLRVLFETGFRAERHMADSIFEVAERNNAPSAQWSNPSNCQHQQAFVTLKGDSEGLTIANLGLNEYEILQDEKGTIAVTLLRA